ncbi:yip1 domain-containing protein [Apiospora marii]|uniref:yip1 domain-containing protein n=1 Tax=Apiospora marii TaxID=335849 RepID=UPI00312E3339
MKRAALVGAAAAAATVSTANAEWFRGGSSSNRPQWEPARATATSFSSKAANALGWTPKPTPGPAEAILRHELMKREGTSTCGYFVGTTSPSAAIVCSGSSQCIINNSNKAMGCCSSSNIQACNVATACIESSDAATISAAAATYTLLCQASAAPSCVTYTYASDSPYSGFRAFACGSKREVLTVAYTAPGAPTTDITSTAGATTTTTSSEAPQNSLPSAGGNEPPITITSSTKSQPPSANPSSAGSPTTNAGSAGSTSSPAPTNQNNSNNNTPTILAGVIGGVGGLVIILAGLLSSIFYARKKKKENNNPKNRPPIEKIKRPYMPAAFPNSFDYIAAYREARMSRRQSGRPQSGFSRQRQSFVRSFQRRSSMLPFWRQSQQQQHQQNQPPQQTQFPQGLAGLPPRRSEDRRILNSSRFPLPPVPKPPRTVRDIRQEEFDFGTRQSPTFSVPVNRNNRGVGPVPASATTRAGSSLTRQPFTHLESGSTSTLPRPSSMSVETSPRRRNGGAGGGGIGGEARDSGGALDIRPPSAHTDLDSRFTPPFISPPAGLRSPTNDNIGIATVLAPAPARTGGGRGVSDRVVSTTGATAGSMSQHNSRALPSPRSPRAQQYVLYNPKYGRPVGHLNKMQ